MSGYRPAYTIDEDMLILNMIIRTKSYYRIRGRAFWDDLSELSVIDRSWQSLKERFEKKILPRICDSRYTISADKKKKIQLAHYQLTQPFSFCNGDAMADEYEDDETDNENNPEENDDDGSNGEDTDASVRSKR